MTTVLLDSHVAYWWSAEPQRLSMAASQAIEHADELAVAAISWFELAWLAEQERIQLAIPVLSWLQQLAEHVRTVGITPSVAATAVAIPAKLSEERKVNALKFIAFVTNPTNTAYFSQQTGYLPVRKSAVDDASERHYLADNPRARVALDQLPHTRTQDYARVFLPGGDRIISAGLESIGLRGADVTKTFTNIQKRLQVILDRQIMRKLAGHG